jgi:hypothetical protein
MGGPTVNSHIQRALDAAEQLALLAEQGERECVDDRDMVLYGVIRDCAYKIRRLASEGLRNHEALESWNKA